VKVSSHIREKPNDAGPALEVQTYEYYHWIGRDSFFFLGISEKAETVGMSKDRVGHILHEILGMRKLSARWVPRLLTPNNKLQSSV